MPKFGLMSEQALGVIGLGYVGLPLAVEFGKKYQTIGFDINQTRVDELHRGFDRTQEVCSEELEASDRLEFTCDRKALAKANIYIITVPTPVDEFKKPDLTPLTNATELVAENLDNGNIVIYESTVYPGCTEEVCVPILEKLSNLAYNTDFYCGYSPERINPGDRKHRLATIQKVTSGSTPEVAEMIDQLYRSIIPAGTHKTTSIKVAEAAKVIENCQRDINIAFVNELSLIFEKAGIDTLEVLEAAGTKWNFLPFRPGLVGGHCIGVDPYYLTYKAESLGYHPQVILSGRRINDDMGLFVANKLIKMMANNGMPIKGTRVLVLGITFKENCPDIRNTRVVDIIAELSSFGVEVHVYDPHADSEEVKKEFGLDLTTKMEAGYQAVILAVAHEEFKDIDWKAFTDSETIIFDLKGLLSPSMVSARL